MKTLPQIKFGIGAFALWLLVVPSPAAAQPLATFARNTDPPIPDPRPHFFTLSGFCAPQ